MNKQRRAKKLMQFLTKLINEHQAELGIECADVHPDWLPTVKPKPLAALQISPVEITEDNPTLLIIAV